MPRYAGFLRGVTPMNAKMPELKAALEDAGFTNVTTVISSGNVVFDSRKATVESLERKVEKAFTDRLGHSFLTIVRAIDDLNALLAADPYRSHKLASNAKRIVTFLRDQPEDKLDLPIELHGARILAMKGREIFSAYVPTPKGPVFMQLIEKTFGKDVTTRTWETVAKVARR